MSETMKTHRERADEAWAVTSQATSMQDSVRMEPGVWLSPPAAIARLTYPDELVEAAKRLLDRCVEMDWPDGELDDARAALAFYEPEEAGNA